MDCEFGSRYARLFIFSVFLSYTFLTLGVLRYYAGGEPGRLEVLPVGDSPSDEELVIIWDKKRKDRKRKGKGILNACFMKAGRV